jgi:hypothetical protein
MLKLNLFYEQQQIQRAKDLDPVRLTIVAGVLITLGILAWACFIYFRLAPLRSEVALNQLRRDQKKKEQTEMGQPTDLPKIQSQSDSLHNFEINRVLIASQLDTLRTTVPTNCQIRLFQTKRDVKTVTETVKDHEEKKLILSLDMSFEANAQAKDKVKLLQIRDNLFDALRNEPRFRDWVQQAPSETGTSNLVNSVISVSSITKDPNPLKDAKDTDFHGVFEFKMPIAIKDPPKIVN